MRKNARANRARILAAADEVFGARGELGSTEDVAERAGVSIATVFRNFPTKDSLIEAALIRQFDRLNQEATALADDPDPSRALRRLIERLIETSSTKLTLISLVSDNGRFPAAVAAAVDANQSAIAGILERATDEGVIRPDVTVEEFFFVVRGLAQAAATTPARPGTLDRVIEIVLRGLTPTA